MFGSSETKIAMFGGKFAGRRFLITGNTGFKGAWLSILLTRLGAEVYGYADGVPTDPSLFEEAEVSRHIHNTTGDICDVARLRQLIEAVRPDFVIHLAAQAIVSTSYANPIETLRVNVMGTAAVLEALRSVDWPCATVIVTSDKAYDNVEWPWGYRETDALGGKDIYSGSKGAAELVFRSYFASFLSKQPNLRIATARAGNVIGGGDWAADRIVADCIRAWQRGELVNIRSPMATRPWQHVLEPLSGYLTLAARLTCDPSLNGESFNFGPRAEQNATVVELLTSLATIWGFPNPDKSYRITEESPFNEASLLKLNIDKALLALRWEPNLAYEECMQFTATWYRDVLKNGTPAWDMTVKQIDAYIAAALERKRCWTPEGKW